MSSPHLDAFRDAIRPSGCLEESACQLLAVAHLYYERATALAAQHDPDSVEALRFQVMALSWDGSYSRALRLLTQLQTERSVVDQKCLPALADLQEIQRVAKRNAGLSRTRR